MAKKCKHIDEDRGWLFECHNDALDGQDYCYTHSEPNVIFFFIFLASMLFLMLSVFSAGA